MAVDYTNGRYKAISPSGKLVGRMDDGRHIKKNKKQVYTITGDQLTDERHNGDLVGLFEDGKGMDFKRNLIFTLVPE